MNGLITWRFRLVLLTMLAAALYVLGSYAYHTLKDNPGKILQPRISAERGMILDRNGKTLAAQTNDYHVYVSPPEEEKIPALAMYLAPILDMDEEELYNSISGAKGSFLLKRQVSIPVVETIKNDLKNGNVRNVSITSIPVRAYPEKNLAAQIIGFTGNNNIGLEGVEYAFNKELSENNNVTLTIDINVQHILEKVAASTLHETQAESVMFLAMDNRNGDILGSAVLPGFDPNYYRASNNDKYLNLSAREHYEPGSVFKAFSISALMDSGVISEHSEFICNGVYEKVFSSGEKVRIECADGNAHGRVRPREIIIYSCNVGAAFASDRVDNQTFYQLMLNYGFGKKTGAWVNTETAGLLKETDLWSGRTRQSIAFGQEVAVSALQIMQAATVIANSGMLVPPRLISRISSADGKTVTEWENSDNTGRQVIMPETAQKMLSYMTDTTTEGTGRLVNIRDINVAVKTGTSQYRDPLTRGYSTTDFIASCVALLPAESPSLILYAVIIKPRGETYGGRIAAPAIREAAEQLVDYLGIPRGRNPIVEHPGSINIAEERLPVIGAYVPDFYGLSKKTLLPLLFHNEIRVEISGEGWVQKQSPAPGTPIVPGTVIELILE